MKKYLDSLAERVEKEDPNVIIWEVGQAIDEVDQRTFSPRAQELCELVSFCLNDGIAPWLKDKRDALIRVRDYARKLGDKRVASMLDDVLNGVPHSEVTFALALTGQELRKLDIDAGEVTKFGGIDWGSTDIALSFAMDEFTSAVLRDLIEASQEFDLQAPLAVRQRVQVNSKINAEVSALTAIEIFQKLVSVKNPVIEAGSWEDAENVVTERAIAVSIRHIVNAPASPKLLSNLDQKFGSIVTELLSIYAAHNGAELFQYKGECGFYLAPIEQWDNLHAQAVEWAESVTWQEDKSEIPPYLYSAIAFGMIPGDSERWLLITEGKHAGKIMLSDSDLIDDHPRFESVAQLLSTLLNDVGRVLNSGGYISYAIDDTELFPIRYTAAGESGNPGL